MLYIETPKDAELYANYLVKLGIKYAKIMLGNYEVGLSELEDMIDKRGMSDLRLVRIVDSYFPSSGTYSSATTFCLNFHLYFYVCGSFGEVSSNRGCPRCPSSAFPSYYPRSSDQLAPGSVLT